MKKIILSLTIITLSVGSLFAQEDDKKLSKIAFLMVDGKFEDVVNKAEKLAEDPEYRSCLLYTSPSPRD